MSTKITKYLLASILIFILLAGTASAGTVYSKAKSGVLFQDNIDVTQIDVNKNTEKIEISSNEHVETTVKIKQVDIEAIDPDADALLINHYTDEGFNDWSDVVATKYSNGYMEVNISLSTVSITPISSQVANYMFESWTNSTLPASWNVATGANGLGGWKAPISIVNGSYSYAIAGDGLNIVRGEIYQMVTITTSGNYTLGAWMICNNRTSGVFNIDLLNASLGVDIIGVRATSTEYNTWTWYEATTYMGAGTYMLRVFADGRPNSGSNFIVDGLVLSYKESIDKTAYETDDGTYFNQTFDYYPLVVYPNSVFLTEYQIYNLADHGKYFARALIDGTETEAVVQADGTRSQVYINTSGLTSASHSVNVFVEYNMPPDLYTPANGSTVSRTFPPLYADQIFTWQDTRTTNQIQIAEDSEFGNIVYSAETSAESITAQLASGEYYWRIRSYDPTYLQYGEWSDTYTFEITASSAASGTGVHGVVYESIGVGNYIAIESAIVTIYNDTYSTTKTTGSSGYFQFNDLANGTYYIYAQANEYEQTAVAPVNVTDGNLTLQNIAMKQSQDYFDTHKVKYILSKYYGVLIYENIAVSVYEGDSTTSRYTGITGDDGAVIFELDEATRYRVEFLGTDTNILGQTVSINATWSGYPKDDVYYITPSGIVIPTEQVLRPSDVMQYSIIKSQKNLTYGYINITALTKTDGLIDYQYEIYEIGEENNTILPLSDTIPYWTYGGTTSIDSGALTSFTKSGSRYLIVGKENGTFVGYKLINGVWTSYAACVGGLSDVGDYAYPAAFSTYSSTGDTVNMVVGNENGTLQGYWSVGAGTSWYPESIYSTGLSSTSSGSSAPFAFWMNGTLYLIVGEEDGSFTGYYWGYPEFGAAQWNAYENITSGLDVAGNYSSSVVFRDQGIYYLIASCSNESSGENYSGYFWNGTGWSDRDFIVGELDTEEPRPSQMIYSDGVDTFMLTSDAKWYSLAYAEGYIEIGTNYTAIYSQEVPLYHTYKVVVTLTHPDLGYDVVITSTFYFNGEGVRPDFDLGWEEQWQYEVLAYILMLCVAGLFGARNIGIGAICTVGVGLFSVFAGWIVLDIAGKLMLSFGMLILLLYLINDRK